MIKKLPILLLILASCSGKNSGPETELQRWENHAANVTIIRDSYGVPHIFGKTDADAVFGLLYAQCEDDFNRVEMNYINAMGRLAEVEGEDEVFKDLRMKLFIDPEDMKEKYEGSPEWLKMLMDAFADGVNYYLHTHPGTQPKLITRFEPWMALTFSEGSIGGDIERASVAALESFYSDSSLSVIEEKTPWIFEPPTGSNGISIAPKNTINGKSLFLINPHTTFFFRSEVHVVSEEGLNAYGAVTWGQFFVYQGFNERLGWMHTSSKADAIDRYLETISEREGKVFYQYGEEQRPMEQKKITVPFKTEAGLSQKEFTGWYTHHGPVVMKQDDKWVTMALMQRPVDALIQSYMRTKAQNYEEFHKNMGLRTNSSNNTVYADADGNIAYYHGNFIPKRNSGFNWAGMVDGSDPASDWQGLHELNETITLLNPENGWIQNCNSTPFTSANEYSPKPEDYPDYMAPDLENFRGVHARRLLQDRTDFTLENLISLAYDSHLPAFEEWVPNLVRYWQQHDDKTDPVLKEAVEMMGAWDVRWSVESVPTTLAVYWGGELLKRAASAPDRGSLLVYEYLNNSSSGPLLLEVFKEVLVRLEEDFGTWKTPWGEVNRYQRITGDIVQDFNDDKPSLPVGFVTGGWGSLASFNARIYPGTKKMYGTSGNSFVAAVEFGDKLRARSLSTGGQSGDPSSPHFSDQAEMYVRGEFKEVRFYREDIEKDAAKTYQPGGK